MDSYKHSCPFCGQHIEYTIGYCGTQMTCPSCGKTVTFPALPPGITRLKLRLKRPEAEAKPAWLLYIERLIPALTRFKHWGTAMAILIPFLVVAGLLAGAVVVKERFGSAPMQASATPVAVDPHALEKMTALERADQLVQQNVRDVQAANDTLTLAKAKRSRLLAANRASTGNTLAYSNAERACSDAETRLGLCKKRFETALQEYQKLGGTIDYRSQLP